MNLTMDAFMRANKQGFLLQDVSKARLAQRRRNKNSSDSGYSGSHFSPVPIFTSSPMSGRLATGDESSEVVSQPSFSTQLQQSLTLATHSTPNNSGGSQLRKRKLLPEYEAKTSGTERPGSPKVFIGEGGKSPGDVSKPIHTISIGQMSEDGSITPSRSFGSDVSSRTVTTSSEEEERPNDSVVMITSNIASGDVELTSETDSFTKFRDGANVGLRDTRETSSEEIVVTPLAKRSS